MQAAVNEDRGMGITQSDELQRFVSAAAIEEYHMVRSYRGVNRVALLHQVDPATVPTNSRSRLLSMKIEEYPVVTSYRGLS